MKQIRVLSLLLALCLVCALLPATAGAAGYTEVRSAAEMAQALADMPAQPMSRRASAKPVQVLVLEPALPDTCGAQRVLHYAAAEEFILEFASLDAAETAYQTLTETYGLRHCWLDTPEQGAHVMDDGASAMAASTWGTSYMNLTSYRNDLYTLKHFNAAQTCVAIIDSGVDPKAENLVARSYQSYDFVHNTTELSDVTAAGNSRGHGTRMASILDSVLPENVRFMYLRVFDEASATRVRVLTALQYAVEQGADVINMSLGWEDDTKQDYTFLDSAIRAAQENQAVIVCAAGNEHQDVENSYPANHAYTIAVSAVNQRLQYESYYSNYGALIDFCAPGSGITATTVGGQTVSCVGTSFSAPHITAVATELKILEPAATRDRIYKLLCTYSKDLGVAGKDNNYGWGIPILPENYTGLIQHIWDEGRVTRVATETKSGERLFTCAACGEQRVEVIPATRGRTDSGFVDVPRTEYYAAPVAWAAANGITTGADETHFLPNGICTRAHVVTFLWRTAGSPQPKSTQNQFTDVDREAYYYQAVLWAVENGITNGVTDTTFEPDKTCTRAHVVTFLWRFNQTGAAAATMDGSTASPMEPATTVSFVDVPADAYYAEAVAWAVRCAITDGMTPTTFEPDTGCTRAHVVTFLYRYVNGAK